MPNVEALPVTGPHRLTRQGAAVLAAMVGMILGAACAAAFLHAHNLDKDARQQARMRELSSEARGLRRDSATHAATRTQLADAQASLALVSGQLGQISKAHALALQVASTMPPLKTPAYREPFERMTDILKAANLREPPVGAAQTEGPALAAAPGAQP